MAEPMERGSAVPLEEVVLAQAFEFEALLIVLERKGMLKRAEVLEEITRLRKAAAKTQGTRQGSREAPRQGHQDGHLCRAYVHGKMRPLPDTVLTRDP